MLINWLKKNVFNQRKHSSDFFHNTTPTVRYTVDYYETFTVQMKNRWKYIPGSVSVISSLFKAAYSLKKVKFLHLFIIRMKVKVDSSSTDYHVPKMGAVNADCDKLLYLRQYSYDHNGRYQVA